ncbi:hypothetical protein WJX81_006039 [Elliptochloris bilobata]|uniref:Uncharacterized protein n=1 Tax=Elliptochloris bilobata TaxID=381761 RepID=A0AAW1RE23_9CHLO
MPGCEATGSFAAHASTDGALTHKKRTWVAARQRACRQRDMILHRRMQPWSAALAVALLIQTCHAAPAPALAPVPVPAPAPAPLQHAAAASAPGAATGSSAAPGTAPAAGPAAGPAAAPGGAEGSTPGCSAILGQRLAPARPYPAALGSRGGVLSGDGNVAVLSGDAARGGLAATAYVFAYSPITGNYSFCPQVLEDPVPQAGLDFGAALAIAEDASSVVVGAGGRVQLNAIGGGTDTAVDGRVYVFRLPDLPTANSRGYSSTPVTLQPSSNGAHSPSFGSAGLATSASGDMVFVGAPAVPQANTNTAYLYGNASVYVFKRDSGGNGYVQFAALPAPDGTANFDFGRQVALTKGGELLAVSDPLYISSAGVCAADGLGQGLSSGIVYLYRRDPSGNYVLSQRLTANASAVTGFGAAMALAADGSILLVGQPDAPLDTAAPPYPILTFVAVSNATVKPGGVLRAPAGLPPSARFGQAIAVAGDGSQALVSVANGPRDDSGAAAAAGGGAVYGFHLEHSNGSVAAKAHLAGLRSPDARWFGPGSQQTTVDRLDIGGAAFGRTLALSADGVRLLAAGGAPSGALDPPAGAQRLAQPSRAYVFRLQNCGTTAHADPIGA